jgi:hypothetical protein
MAITAELADGRRLEFPDGTDPGVVQSTVKRMLSESASAAMAKPDEPGAGEAALIAAGRATDKIVKGAQQLYYGAKSQFESPTLSSLIAGTPSQQKLNQMANEERENDRLYEPLAKARPISTTVGGLAPSVAASMLTGGTSILGSAATAALPSLMSYGSAEERLKRGGVDALGGAAGAMGAKVIGAALKPAGAGTAGASADALAAAERIGFKPLPGQQTQNLAIQNFENYLARSPGSAGKLQAVNHANQTALNRAGAKSMGELADTLDEGVFAAAKGRIGGEFDRLGQITQPDLTGSFLNVLAKVDADNAAKGAFQNTQVRSLVDKALDLAANNNLNGKAYKEVRSELANQAQAAFKAGDATTGQAYKSVYAALDDAAKASLAPADQKAWDVARMEWKALKTLAKSNVAEAGNLSGPRAAAAIRSQNPNFRTGGMSGELADIARVGEAFKSVPNPNSGNLMQQMIFGNPFTGLPVMAANKLAASAYMSPAGQRYFANGLVDLGETGMGLLGRAGAQTAIPVGRNLLGVE